MKITEEQYIESCFFFDQACEVHRKLLNAVEAGDWNEFRRLREQHRLLVLRHKRVKEGYYGR